MGENILLMPTYNTFDKASSKYHINSHEERLNEINNRRRQFIVTQPAILKQLITFIPKITHVLDIREITRVDGRLDEEGNLRFFDINGFPGLNMRGATSDIVNLCFLFFPTYPKELVYEALIHTLIAGALTRNGLQVPKVINELNLFTLDSDLVIKVEKK